MQGVQPARQGIAVSLLENQVFSDYEIQTYSISNKQDNRLVSQSFLILSYPIQIDT
jgi:hypothetical protein